MYKIITLSLLYINLHAVALVDNYLIVVHLSTYYRSNSKTIAYTNQLVLNSIRSILTFQNDPATDPKWYVTRQSQDSYYSRAEELDVSFNKSDTIVKLYFAGGYLTSC
jgi:hypothetical protein